MMIFFIHISHAETIIIGTDINDWYPYTFMKDNKPAGIHIEIVMKAFQITEHTLVFRALPWKRCLKGIKTGELNAVVSASYKKDRAEYMIYPTDAMNTRKSRWRITQVSYIIVTRKDTNYIYKGDLTTLPEPILAPLGYSIVDDLRTEGINIKTEYTTQYCIQTINRLQTGSLILTPGNAEMINKTLSSENKLTIHTKPIKSKSYFMTFSIKMPKLSRKEIELVWDEIENIRNNESYMNQLLSKYR